MISISNKNNIYIYIFGGLWKGFCTTWWLLLGCCCCCCFLFFCCCCCCLMASGVSAPEITPPALALDAPFQRDPLFVLLNLFFILHF